MQEWNTGIGDWCVQCAQNFLAPHFVGADYDSVRYQGVLQRSTLA